MMGRHDAPFRSDSLQSRSNNNPNSNLAVCKGKGIPLCVCFELGHSLPPSASFTLGILPLAFPLSLLLLLYIPTIPLVCLP